MIKYILVFCYETPSYGMYFGSCRNITVSGCIIQQNANIGLYFQDVDDSSVVNTTITSNTNYGFWHNGNRNLITDTTVSHTNGGPGIKILGIGYHNNSFIQTEVSHNGEDGVTMDDADNTTFQGCSVHNNSYNGMLINGEEYPNTIDNCTISDNQYTGIVLNNVRYMKIMNSLISTNQEKGIELDDCADNNLFHNFFNNNTENARDDGTNTWDNGLPAGGNRWSDFDEAGEGAYDNDTNGIIDDPYTVPGRGNQDRYPLGGQPALNDPPIANAGTDRQVINGTTVTLDGSGSTDDVGVVNWVWTFQDNGSHILIGESRSYQFITIGNFSILLTVWDGEGLSDNDTIWVNVTGVLEVPDTEKPVPVITIPEVVYIGEIVALDGTLSHDNVGVVKWEWEIPSVSADIITGPNRTIVFSATNYSIRIKLVVYDAAGNFNANIDYISVLYRPGTISGTVVDSQRRELSGVLVSFEWEDDLETQTTVNGNFSFQNMPAMRWGKNTYTLIFNKTGYKETSIDLDLVTGKNVHIDMELLTQEEFEKKKKDEEKADKTCWGIMMTLLFVPIGILQFRRKN